MLGLWTDGHASDPDRAYMWIGDFVRGHSVVRVLNQRLAQPARTIY